MVTLLYSMGYGNPIGGGGVPAPETGVLLRFVAYFSFF